VAAADAAAAAGLLLPSCCNGTPEGWDWSLIARGVVSRTRVGYNEIATNDRVRSCPGEHARGREGWKGEGREGERERILACLGGKRNRESLSPLLILLS